MAPVVVVAGTTLPEAVWLMDSLELKDARAVSMGQVSVEGVDVSAAIITPSLALALHGVLGETKQAAARRLTSTLHRSLVRNVGARVRGTSLHAHIKRDYALPEGFYYLPLTATAEPEFAPVGRTVETRYENGDMERPEWRKVIEHFEGPKQSAPQIGSLTFVSSGPPEADVDDVVARIRTLGGDRIGR